MHIKIRKGLDIPLKGNAQGEVAEELPLPSHLALELSPFHALRFRPLKELGERVRIGEPLVYDKQMPRRCFVSPASGEVVEVIRGEKRRIEAVVIRVEGEEQFSSEVPAKEKLMEALALRGLLPHIEVRPCPRPAEVGRPPECILIKAIESAPFTPPPELEIDERFQVGIDALRTLAEVHLVSRRPLDVRGAITHTAAGPHPIGNASVLLAAIHPLTSPQQTVWVLDVGTVVAIGELMTTGHYKSSQLIAIAGAGIPEHQRGFFLARRGYPVEELIRGRCELGMNRLISGDPLMGRKVECGDFLGFSDKVFCALPEGAERRRFMHFFRLFGGAYSSLHGYLPGRKRGVTTSKHGEERAFIDGAIYDRVMPLKVPTMHLIKALLAEDWERARELGILEVAPEDFALPTFIDPSKIEMTEIAKRGLSAYAAETLS